MAFLNNFDANTVDPATSFDPIPEGKYIASIIESEMKPTQNRNGHYLELVFEILDGEHKGRKVWARLNLDNPSAKAVIMAQKELSAICHAVGIMQPHDSVELHNLPLSIKVACKKREDNGEITNEIKGYEKKEAAFASGNPTPAAPAPQAAPAAGGTAPWSR